MQQLRHECSGVWLQGKGHFRKPDVAAWIGFYLFSSKPAGCSWWSSLVRCRVTNGSILSIMVLFSIKEGQEGAVRLAIVTSCGAHGSQIVCPFRACSREDTAKNSHVAETFRPIFFILCCIPHGWQGSVTGRMVRIVCSACLSLQDSRWWPQPKRAAPYDWEAWLQEQRCHQHCTLKQGKPHACHLLSAE